MDQEKRWINQGFLLQIDKVGEASGDLTCHVFAVDSVLHIKNNCFFKFRKLSKNKIFILFFITAYFLQKRIAV